MKQVDGKLLFNRRKRSYNWQNRHRRPQSKITNTRIRNMRVLSAFSHWVKKKLQIRDPWTNIKLEQKFMPFCFLTKEELDLFFSPLLFNYLKKIRACVVSHS